MNKTIVITIILIILLGILFWGLQTGFFAGIFSGPAKPVAIPEGIILFYGEGCPHCKNVDDFVAQNKIGDKVKFTKLEVWYNKDNQTILGEVAQKCGITSGSVGVPFLFVGNNKCVSGDVDVISLFKNATGIK
ncbi:MAG: thioredoxin family protein [Candidatus Staskawiczbacteria bacterium]|nr:thioredoxin family protein [Candidatus Staskawiczbacteria bacterium]